MGEVVDLDHDAVDLVVEIVAMFLPVQTVIRDRVDRVECPNVFVDRKPESAEVVELGSVRWQVGAVARDLAELVGEERQLALSGLGGILLAQAPGRGVAGVDERLLTGGERSLVEPLERRPGHVHLAADFEQRWGGVPVAADHRGDIRDRCDVGRHVLTGAAVASRRCPQVPAVLVAQADGQAVELQLADERRRGTVETLDDAVGPRPEFVGIHRVVEAHHGDVVLDGVERRHDGTPDLLRRRVGRDQVGVFGFERAELADEVVVVGVADLGVVERVVALVVMGDPGAQIVDSAGGVSGHRIAPYPGRRRPQAPKASFVEIAWAVTFRPTSEVRRETRLAVET